MSIAALYSVLAAKEHSPLRKQTMDISHRPHRPQGKQRFATNNQ